MLTLLKLVPTGAARGRSGRLDIWDDAESGHALIRFKSEHLFSYAREQFCCNQVEEANMPPPAND